MNAYPLIKICSLLLLFFVQLPAYTQLLEEREKITHEFSQTNPQIVLVGLDSDSLVFATMTIKSDYLASKGIDPEIIGYRISGTDKEAKTLFLSEMIYQSSIPQRAIETLKHCEACTHFFIDRVTLKWFNGTYTIKATKSSVLNLY